MLIKEFRQYGTELKRDYKAGNKSLKEKLSLMSEIMRYIKEGDWTREDSRKKYISWVEAKYDYKKVSADYNTSPECLTVFLTRQNKRLESIIRKPFELIIAGDLSGARLCFFMNTGCISPQAELSYMINELLPEASSEKIYSVKDCAAEVKLLSGLLKLNMQKTVDSVDRDKLAYLMFLLGSSDETYAAHKYSLICELIKK